VLLDVDQSANHIEGAGSTHAQIQAIPHHGLGFNILLDRGHRRLHARLSRARLSSIMLNYVGDLDHRYRGLAAFRLATEWDEAIAEAHHDTGQTPWHPRLEITATIEEGDLLLWTTYHDHAYRPATIERLANRMLEILTQLSHGVQG
jgi:non-ribosomal peptide synthase protein (TIGR01720 family)